MPSDSATLHIHRARRRVFDTPAELPPQHLAALDVFLTDLVRPYGLAVRDDVRNGQVYGEMAAELIGAIVPPHERVDLLVLAFAIPDLRPGRATATYLSHVCPGGPLAFALCDQGTAAAFTGLRLAREYLSAGDCERALLLVVEQAVLPYATEAQTMVPDRHAAVAFLCGLSGVAKLRTLAQYPNVSAERATELLESETEAAGPGVTVIRGAGLAGELTGQPFTGAWWELAATLDLDTAVDVLVADYDPLLRYLSLARFTGRCGNTSAPTG